MPPVPPRRRRARPVPDASIDALLTRSEDLAKGWLLALLEDAPLQDAPAILAADLTRDGPRVCEAMLRAVADDVDLRRLEPGGALVPLMARAGALAGAGSPGAVARAVDALQAILWTAVREELRGPDPDLIAALMERLSLVTEVVRGAALERGDVSVGGEPPVALRAAPSPREVFDETADASASPPPPSPPRPSPPRPSPPPAEAAAGQQAPATAWPDDARRRPAAPGDALWIGALEDEIQRAAGTGSLSLLLAELEDAERVAAVDPAGVAFTDFTAAVRSAMRRQDILVCESTARAWIIARDTPRPGAFALGERIAHAVRGSTPWRGAPLGASVGVAVLGEDGRTSAELIEAAEEARFAAAARGVEILREGQPGGG